MFILSRAKYESVRIGSEIVVTVTDIGASAAVLGVTVPRNLSRLILPDNVPISPGQHTISLLPDQAVQIGPDIRVILVKIRSDRIRLGIDYPRELRIERS